jgi:thiaminase/transcriptional activator TenA
MYYLVQDYIFLMHFSRAWALAVMKSETVEEMQLCAATVNALISDEIKLHIGICAEAGIDQATLSNASEATENLAYTRYVLDAGHSGDMIDLLAALAPCVMGYGEIGLRLCQSNHATDYADWINTYGDTDYQNVCIAVGQLIDTACHRRLGEDPAASPRWPLLQKRFDVSTKLETGFWQMGLDG